MGQDAVLGSRSTSCHPRETAKLAELRFRALLTEDGAEWLELARA
jgi:hypothetical protein